MVRMAIQPGLDQADPCARRARRAAKDRFAVHPLDLTEGPGWRLSAGLMAPRSLRDYPRIHPALKGPLKQYVPDTG